MQQRLIVEAKSGWRGIDWRELYRYRDMFRFLTLRSVRARYAQSVIGMGWAVIQPLFSMIVFSIVFGRLARVSSDGAPYALFSFVALVPWTYFSNALSDSTSSLISNAAMLNKVYFPRLILPLSAVAAKLVDFAIALVVLLGMLLFNGLVPNGGVVVLPLLILIMILAAAGAGMWLTSLAVQYRDVSYAMGFVVQLLMYAAPVVYPASLVPLRFQTLYAINPMVGVIEGFRSVFLGTRPMPWSMIGIGAVSTLLLALSGAAYFRSKERIFADVA
ncbi:MAG TPA: ABC transporter permease [Gemmatimonadaceae bacterium]|nr:ABC transporter permease [Gemmatimonadaceae bacterium]